MRYLPYVVLLLLGCRDRSFADNMVGLTGAVLKQEAEICVLTDHKVDQCPKVSAQRRKFVKYCQDAAPWWKSVNCDGQADLIISMGVNQGEARSPR